MKNAKCKICRRLNTKLFLKGERCLSVKCAMIKRAYPPGLRKKRGRGNLSEYAKELREKQKLKNYYHLGEKQFRNYVKTILSSHRSAASQKKEDAPTLLIKALECRLDNVIFRLGLASSRIMARQMITHRHFLVNDKKINIPSFQLKKGDKIAVNPKSSKKNIFQNLINLLKKQKTPAWLELNAEKLEGKVTGYPVVQEVAPPAEISLIFEYYSK